MKFAEALIINQETLRNDIKDFFAQNMLSDMDKDYSLRISQHALYLKLTELLYRKYVLDSSEEDSCQKQLYEAIDNNYIIQSRELMNLRKEDESDIVVDLFNMFNGKYLKFGIH